jgi:hypothetical protein
VRPLKDIKVLSTLNENELREFLELIHNAEASYFIYLDELEKLLKFFKRELEKRRNNGDAKPANELSEFVSKLEEMINEIPTPQLMVLKASGVPT